MNLTPREQEVLRLYALGYTEPQIAAKLCISEHTVHAHLRNARTRSACKSSRVLALKLAQNIPL